MAKQDTKKVRRHFTRARRAVHQGETKHLEKLNVKRDDTVEVLWGEHKGKRGTVLRAIPAAGMVVVQGVNSRWKHLRRSQDNPQGGRLEREQPIPACKVRKVEE